MAEDCNGSIANELELHQSYLIQWIEIIFIWGQFDLRLLSLPNYACVYVCRPLWFLSRDET